ncbi:lipid-A-disaccharide synthase [Polycladidibacter hongkongensis]|uniref:lipid-A-disaccharide synthase n=1 Tax=Polycladidibacter hongkongensis TaxID=1647556 RepID=UPI000836FFED|nr:lipid-A-disaccharide synthase [Pseudovibrio hongkongensis]
MATEREQGATQGPLKLFVVVGEESGDQLGAELVKALRPMVPQGIDLQGVGGERLEAQGLTSLFDLEEIAVMGISAVLARLPKIVKRVYQTVDAVAAARPDVLLIIDSPDFTHNVAKRVRKRAPHIPIIDYVSPSVWAWRSGRAKKMSAYVDHLLALLPFEPAAHARLGGPATTYVGHPLIERLAELRPAEGERSRLGQGQDTLLVLPGSRGSEVTRLLEPFGETVRQVCAKHEGLRVVVPAVKAQEARIREGVAAWGVPVEIVCGEQAKFAAFRRAHAALAASGTVSLELAIAGVPMVVAYKLDWFFRRLKWLNTYIKIAEVDSIVLPNLVAGENFVPEFIEEDAAPDKLAGALLSLLTDTGQREVQLEAMQRLDSCMRLPSGDSQARAAANILVKVAGVQNFS